MNFESDYVDKNVTLLIREIDKSCYIQGVSMGSLQLGVDIPRPEASATAIADRVMDAFRAIKVERCVMHNNVHIDNILLCDSERSPVLIDFEWALTKEPKMSDQE